MKLPKQTGRFTLAVALAALLAGNARGAMLGADNSVNFGGSVQFDSLSLSSATTVEAWWSAIAPDLVTSGISRVQSISGGDFVANIEEGAIVDMRQPWVFGSGVSDLWEVGGFSFDLTSSNLDFQSGSFINISGSGVITGNGFDPTPGTWFFTAQLPEAGGRFSYSAGTTAVPRTATVPDGGATLGLLGIALGGIELLRRRRKA